MAPIAPKRRNPDAVRVVVPITPTTGQAPEMAELARNSVFVAVDGGTIRIGDFEEVLDPSIPRREVSPVVSEWGNHLYVHCSRDAGRVQVTARFFDTPGEGGDASMEDAGTARLEFRSQFLAVRGSQGSNFLWGAPFQGPALAVVFHAGRSEVDGSEEERYLIDFSPAR